VNEEAAVDDAVYRALARQLGCAREELAQSADSDLETLGLDSQGLLRVLLDIEPALGLDELDLPDEAYATPATLARAVAARRS